MSPFPDLWPGFLISLLFSLYGLLRRASSPSQRWIGIGLSFAAGVPGLLSLVALASEKLSNRLQAIHLRQDGWILVSG